MSFGHLDDGLLLYVEVAFGNVVDELFDNVEALIHFLNVHEVTVHRIGSCERDLAPFHFVVHIVGMVLANIVTPTCSTPGRACHAVGDAVCLVHWANAFKAVVGDHVIAEHIHVFLNHWTEIFAEVFHVLDEVLVNIVLQSADAVVVLNEASTSGFFHHVEHVFAVAHTVEECCECAKVLCAASAVQQV